MSTKNLNINGMTEIDDVLAMIADKVVYGDKDGAIDSINELRDYFEEQSAESQTVFADARDHHLVHQDFNRAFGVKR
jgi:benzoyl-CoA reductase/2-hydroxyglutaryl-CoA dehydratase subunit BcrC/BadD/HgdB